MTAPRPRSTTLRTADTTPPQLVSYSFDFTNQRLSKVQLVRIWQSLPRRLAGFGSLGIETAAVREGAGGIVNASTLVPVVDDDRIDEVVQVALPDTNVDVDALSLHPPHPTPWCAWSSPRSSAPCS